MIDALVVRPGDTLLVCIGERCTLEQASQIKAALHARLPSIADVVVLSATQIAIYRPDAEADLSGDPGRVLPDARPSPPAPGPRLPNPGTHDERGKPPERA